MYHLSTLDITYVRNWKWCRPESESNLTVLQA